MNHDCCYSADGVWNFSSCWVSVTIWSFSLSSSLMLISALNSSTCRNSSSMMANLPHRIEVSLLRNSFRPQTSRADSAAWDLVCIEASTLAGTAVLTPTEESALRRYHHVWDYYSNRISRGPLWHPLLLSLCSNCRVCWSSLLANVSTLNLYIPNFGSSKESTAPSITQNIILYSWKN